MTQQPDAGVTADDDSIIEKADAIVDDILGENLAPEEPETRWERRQRILDSWTAILLAVAAVATAWASFQASQWSGDQADNQSASAMARSDAGRLASEATGDEIVDSQMWLSWLNAAANKQVARADFFEKRFSPTLAAAQAEWLTGVQLDANGDPVVIPPGTPMDLPDYMVPSQKESNEISLQAEEYLIAADEASHNATRFVLLALIFALVLFFASIATKFTNPKTQALLVVLSFGLLLFGIARMLVLPQLL